MELLTPFQAENDHHIKDTYNYMTVQTDTRICIRHLNFINDNYYLDRMQAVIGRKVTLTEHNLA